MAMYKIAVVVDRGRPMAHFMDSQLTLVDAHSPASPGENAILIFDRDNMRNTTLRIRGNYLPSYSVDTFCNTTSVYAGDCLLATITRRVFRRDQIAFPGSKPMNLGDWLKAPILSTFPLVFYAYNRRFEWRVNLSEELVLCESSCPGDVVAWFSKSHRDVDDHVIQPAYLAIKSEMDEMRDVIVLSCILAEHKLRVISAAQRETAVYSMVSAF